MKDNELQFDRKCYVLYRNAGGAPPKPCGLEKRTKLGKIDMEKRTKKSLKQL